jgi:hypothetical protein
MPFRRRDLGEFVRPFRKPIRRNQAGHSRRSVSEELSLLSPLVTALDAAQRESYCPRPAVTLGWLPVGDRIMVEKRGTRWTPKEDDLFRRMAEANIRPELIAAKLNRSVHAIKARAYAIGLPLKWFRLKAKGK